jgi:ubiquinone/menaquinone biosynthesis C-methylase UbiE
MTNKQSNLAIGFKDVDATNSSEVYADHLRFQYDLPFFKQYKAKTYELIAAMPGEKVLEIGCGLGFDAEVLANAVDPEGSVYGIDSSADLIKAARERTKEMQLALEFCVMDAADLSFEDGFFDVCHIDRVLMHVEEPLNVLKEAMRVLKPGGRILCFEPDWGTLVINAKNSATTKKYLDHWSQSLAAPWIGRQVSGYLQQLGITDLSITGEVCTLTDYATSNRMYCIEQNAKELVEKGIITHDESKQWLDELQSMSKNGEFFCSLTLFMVHGVKS